MTATTPQSDSQRSGVLLTVFGGLHLFVDGVEADIGPQRQRTILAVLLAARGATVPITQLIDILWNENAPASASNQIHRHVGNLRRLIEPGLDPRRSGSYLGSRGTGYVLHTHALESDIERFFELVDRVHAADAPGDRAKMVLEALALASAPAFPELPPDVRASTSFAALNRNRLALAPLAIDGVRLGVATAEAVLPGVEAMAAEEPFDEVVQSSLIRLLHLAGRRADAIDVFDRTRKALADDLGIDPGAELRAAHLEVLDSGAGDISLHSTDVPHALPPAIPGFVERSEILPLLTETTDSAARGDGSIAVLSGMGGIGKTTLAVHWATTVAHRFPDGQLYLNLFGYDSNRQPLSAEDGFNRLLEQLGESDPIANPSERLDRYRQLLAGMRVLLLLDNARDAEQVRPFLPGGPGCLTIVTSRDRLAGLLVRDGARSIPLARWGKPDSRALFTARLGSTRAETDPEALDSILDSCAGLPLALAIAAARSVLMPDSTLPQLAIQLSQRARVLDSLAASDDSDLRATFEWSYRALSPEAARTFRHLAAHPGPHMSVAAIATCSQRSLAETRRLVDALVSSNMATETGSDRIEIHDLLRAYADELLDESGERVEAEVRLIEHYVRSTREAYGQFGRIVMVDLQLREVAPASVEHFSTAEEALAWYALERPVLFAVLRRARVLGLPRLCALIALEWRPMNQILDAASDSIDACRVAFDAALETSEPLLIAELARELGNKCSMLGLVEEARAHTLHALKIFQELDEPAGEANAYRNLSVGALRTGDIAGQIYFGELAVGAARRSGRPDILSLSLYAHAQSVGQTEDLELEHALLIESLAQGRLAGPGFDLASAMVSLAWNAQLRESYEEAQSWAREARDRDEAAFDVSIQVGMEAMLAYVGMKLGDLDEAASAVKRFDEMFEQHGSHAIQEWDSESVAEVQDYIEQARAWVDEQPTS